MRVESLLEKAERMARSYSQKNRVVDLALQFVEYDGMNENIYPTGRVSKIYGGVWDKLQVNDDGSVGGYIKGALPVRIAKFKCNRIQFSILTDDTSPNLVIVGSRRSSKTVCLAGWVLKRALMFPGKKVTVLVMQHAKTEAFMNDKFLPNIPSRWLRGKPRKSQHKPGVDLVNNARIAFLTGRDPNAARSEGVSGAAVDERQSIDVKSVENSLFSISEAGGKTTEHTNRDAHAWRI